MFILKGLIVVGSVNNCRQMAGFLFSFRLAHVFFLRILQNILEVIRLDGISSLSSHLSYRYTQCFILFSSSKNIPGVWYAINFGFWFYCRMSEREAMDENNEDADMKDVEEDSDFEDDDDNIESIYDEEEVNEEEDEDEEEEGNDGEESAGPLQTYLPGKPLEEGEELVCDENAYVMLHQANTGNSVTLGFFFSKWDE